MHGVARIQVFGQEGQQILAGAGGSIFGCAARDIGQAAGAGHQAQRLALLQPEGNARHHIDLARAGEIGAAAIAEGIFMRPRHKAFHPGRGVGRQNPDTRHSRARHQRTDQK